MTFAPANIAEFASSRETSNEIALAIFEIAAEGEEGPVWANPTDAEIAAIEARASALAPADTDVLNWGNARIRRPVVD